jgi:hypothetical protein
MEDSTMNLDYRHLYTLLVIVYVCAPASARQYCQAFGVLHVDGCNSRLILDRSLPTDLQRGRMIALHCAQSLMEEDDSLTGTVTLCTIDTVIHNSIFLQEDVTAIATSANRIQLIIPLTDEVISTADTLACIPWNGSYGGVIFMYGSHIDLRNVIVDASASGFRGGQQTFSYVAQIDTTRELIQRTTGECYLGRTKMHAGQFGNLHNGGGSGASARVFGGSGGNTSSAFEPVTPGTSPGISWNRPLLVFGSGGGAGHHNDLSHAAGGRGGGLIVIIADSVSTSAQTILDVSGEHGQPAIADGAGGGGAGGTIAYAAGGGLGKAALRCLGGNGGEVHCSTITAGPGGGGAGGTVYAAGAPPGILLVMLHGGLSGRVHCADSSSKTNGAGNGQDGLYGRVASLVTIATQRTTPPVHMRAIDTIVDYGSTTLIELSGEGVVTWDNPALVTRSSDLRLVETPAITLPVWFAVTVITANGCVVRDSIRIRPKLDAVSMNIEADYIRAVPGDTIDMFLRMTLSSPLQRTVQGIVSISTNAAVAHALESATAHDGRATLHVPFTVNSGATTTFRRQQLAITLGDSLTSQISIDSVAISGPALPVRRRHGRITLDSICIAGGRPRLFDPNAPTLQIVGRRIVTLADEVTMYDVLGRSINGLVSRDAHSIVTIIPEDIHGLVLISIAAHGRVWSRSIWID